MEKHDAKEKTVNPYENPPAGTIVITKQADGNWKGFYEKNGQIISERQYDPQIVLQLLLVRG